MYSSIVISSLPSKRSSLLSQSALILVEGRRGGNIDALSAEDLKKVIDQLDENMRAQFQEQFARMRTEFDQTFRDLFGGGKAQLKLTEGEDVLESGIEIKAAPPGKVIKNLMQLSGGEQSFIGVALFFAILQVNPTPFCILDEIEAALDEVNVARLAEYIKRYDGNTQFILITHRRGTMEASDVLYGVTMQEQGVSKLLRLDLNQMEEYLGITE